MSPLAIIGTICFMLAFVVGGNYAVHLYFKSKHRQLLRRVGNKPFVQIKNIRTEIYATTKLSVSWQLMRADVVLTENNLYLLLRYSYLGGYINQNQAVVMIAKDPIAPKPDEVSRIYLLEGVECTGMKMKINATTLFVLKSSFAITLDFSNRPEDLSTLSQFITTKPA